MKDKMFAHSVFYILKQFTIEDLQRAGYFISGCLCIVPGVDYIHSTMQ